MIDSINKLFIVGVGRSGTSLIQSMLASHSGIVMMPETSFIRRYLIRSIFKTKQMVSFHRLSEDKFVQRWALDGLHLDPIKQVKSNSYNDIYNEMAHMYVSREQNSVRYVADKDPKMIESLPHLNKVFCKYKVIHILRDPRDVLLSKNKARWSEKQSLLKKMIANRSQLAISEYYLKNNREKMLEIKYEDLLKEPEQVLIRICEFLGVEFDDNMLKFQEQAKQLVSTDETSWKKETTGPLLTSNCFKWKDEMQPKVIALTQKCCEIAMMKGAYEYSIEKLSLIQRFYNHLFYFCVILLSRVYMTKAIYFTKKN